MTITILLTNLMDKIQSCSLEVMDKIHYHSFAHNFTINNSKSFPAISIKHT